jgi:superfamily I DNA/RNA helicase
LDSFAYADREPACRLLKKLTSGGIPTKWVSKDVRAKEDFDVTTDRVSLLSIHSAKGLDFDLVYLMGVDRIQPKDDTRDYLTHLLYVAITRAKHRLVIPHVEESEFIMKMKSCFR